MDTPKQPEIPNEIMNAKKIIMQYLQERIAEKDNAIEGERPDESSHYSDDYYKQKLLREQLQSFLEIVDSEDDNSANSQEEFIQQICQKIQNFPEESYEQLFNFIERTFNVKIKPLDKPTAFYISWINHWARQYGITPEELKKIMPFEEFQKFEQSNDTAARIKLLMQRLEGNK